MAAKQYEPKIVFMVLLIFCGIILFFWTMFHITPVPIIVLLLSPLLAFWVLKNEHKFPDDFNASNITFIIFGLSFICTMMVNTDHNKHETYLDRIFLGGQVTAKEVMMLMGDEEQVERKGNLYIYEPQNAKQERGVTIIQYAFMACYILVPILNWRISNLAYKRKEARKPKPRERFTSY